MVLATADVDAIEKNVDLNDHLTRKLREARVTIVKEYTKVEDDSDPGKEKNVLFSRRRRTRIIILFSL